MSMKTQIHGFLHTGQTTTSLERTTKTEEEKLFSSITMLTDFGFISIWTEFFLHSEGMGTYTVMIDSYVHNRFKSTTFSSKWIDWRKESFVLWKLSRSENKYSHSICIVFQVLSTDRFMHRPISNLTLLWTVINALAFWTPQCSLLPTELAFKTHVKQRNVNKQTNKQRLHKSPHNRKQREDSNKNKERSQIVQEPNHRNDLQCFSVALQNVHKDEKPRGHANTSAQTPEQSISFSECNEVIGID